MKLKGVITFLYLFYLLLASYVNVLSRVLDWTFEAGSFEVRKEHLVPKIWPFPEFYLFRFVISYYSANIKSSLFDTRGIRIDYTIMCYFVFKRWSMLRYRINGPYSLKVNLRSSQNWFTGVSIIIYSNGIMNCRSFIGNLGSSAGSYFLWIKNWLNVNIYRDWPKIQVPLWYTFYVPYFLATVTSLPFMCSINGITQWSCCIWML